MYTYNVPARDMQHTVIGNRTFHIYKYNTFTYMYTCTCTHKHIYLYTCICASERDATYSVGDKVSRICIYIYIQIYILYTYKYIHIQIYILYIYKYIHIHICASERGATYDNWG